MDVYEAIDYYKKYDPIKFWGFKGINAYELLADDWHMINRGMNVKDFLLAVFPKRITIKASGNGDIAFFYNPRMDNNDWAKAHYSNFINAANTCESRTVLTFSGQFKCRSYYLLCWLFFPIWFFQCKNIELSIKQRLALIACLARLKMDVHEVIKICKKKKIVVVYSDVYDNGYYLVNILKKRGIKTATMMHSFVPKNHFNLTMSHSDYFLANCEITREYAVDAGYPEHNVFCIGISSEIGIKERTEFQRKGIFAVILDGGIEQSALIRKRAELMIEAAEQFCKSKGYKYILRYHPGEKYCDLNVDMECLCEMSDAREDIHDLLARVDFVILGYTSVMLSAIAQQIPFYRCVYNDGGEFMDIVKKYDDKYKLDFLDVDTFNNIVIIEDTHEMVCDIKQRVFGKLSIVAAHKKAWTDILNRIGQE